MDLDQGIPGVPAVKTGISAVPINFYPNSRLGGLSDNSLIGLRNNLSELIK